MFQMFIKTGCRYSWPQQPGSQVTEGVMWGGLVGNREGWGGGGSVLGHVLSAAFWDILSPPQRQLNTWDWLYLCLRQLAQLELWEKKREWPTRYMTYQTLQGQGHRQRQVPTFETFLSQLPGMVRYMLSSWTLPCWNNCSIQSPTFEKEFQCSFSRDNHQQLRYYLGSCWSHCSFLAFH